MSGKVVLYYFDGRGKMESIRWLLTVAGVEFEEVFLTTREQYQKLVTGTGNNFDDVMLTWRPKELNENFYFGINSYKDGALLFHQVPMVEIDGMKLVQTKAILNYIAGKYNLHGKDLKERAMIDMYSDGAADIMEMIMILPFTPAEQKQNQLNKIEVKAKERSLPAYEKALANSQYLVGTQLSCADVHFFEATLMLEELFPTILSTFPKIQEFQKKMKEIPAISKFLQPSSQRKPQPDEKYVKTAMMVLSHLFK